MTNKVGRIINLGSSSEGNCCFLELFPKFRNKGFRLLLDVGLSYKELLIRMTKNGISLNEVNACLVTHEHNDHSESVRPLVSRGIPCFAPKEVFDKYNIDTQDFFTFKEYQWKPICEGVEVCAFPLEHYDEDRKITNFGYIITLDREFNILFVTDTKFIPQDLTDIKFDLIFIEANYLEDKVRFAFRDAENNKDYGKVARYQRLLDSHFSLENVARTFTGEIKKGLKPYDLSNCKAIFLTHLSSGKDANDSYYRQFLTNYLTANKELVKMPKDLKVIVMKQKGGML